MGAKLYGIGDGEIVPQSDFSASQNENGGWTATQTFKVKKGQIDNPTLRAKFSSGVRATVLDPNLDNYFSFLRLAYIPDLSTVVGGFTVIKVNYSGFWTATNNPGESGGTAEAPTYALRGNMKSVPISLHPKWKPLANRAKNRLGWLLDGRVMFDIESNAYGNINDETGEFTPFPTDVGSPPIWATPTGDELEFATRISDGKTTYDVGTYEWTKRWNGSSGLTAAQLNKLSKITDPPGNPPTPGDRDWLMVGANQEQDGQAEPTFTNEVVFLLSDEGKHDSFLQS